MYKCLNLDGVAFLSGFVCSEGIFRCSSIITRRVVMVDGQEVEVLLGEDTTKRISDRRTGFGSAANLYSRAAGSVRHSAPTPSGWSLIKLCGGAMML